jgi:hypothetical protein
MRMLEQRTPPSVFFMDENHDWTTKIVDECIVG